jgi:hypothetical protein
MPKKTKIRSRVKAAKAAKSKPPKGTKHFVEYQALGGHSDSFRCICGWKSNGYWDLVEAAWDEWLLHAHDTKTEVREVDKDRQKKVVEARDKHLKHLKANRDRLNAQISKLERK